jgi:hypothetical protein
MSGVTKDALHASQNPHSIRSTFAPKTGSFSCSKTHLHHAMLVSIVFSSLAVFGSIGQANYSSANATLDMMSAHKKASGMNIVSTRWGAWSAVGMAIDTRRISANTAFMPSINPHLALDILKNLYVLSSDIFSAPCYSVIGQKLHNQAHLGSGFNSHELSSKDDATIYSTKAGAEDETHDDLISL